ncbi:MAG: ABC transporter permease [Bdellovibrionales bacterium]|nr:ABC transporter permease [Bdellovibrionales bacterium]
MYLLTRFAFRNLLRNWRRTLFTVCSLSMGVALSIWTDNITKGRADDIVEAVTSAYVGHYQVSTAEYRKDELIQDYMNEAQLQSFSGMSPRIHFPSLLSSGENSMPIVLDGIDPQAENLVTNLSSKTVQGEYLAPTSLAECSERQILISKENAEKLNVGLGDKVVVMGQAADGSLGNDLFRVRGIYQTESKAFDKHMAFANYGCVAALGQIQGPHELVFGLPAGVEDKVFEKEMAAKAAAAGLKFTSWKESVPQLYSIVRFSRAIHNAINFILFLVISVGIVNVMMMNVFERTREFGVMAALGTGSKQVVSLVLLETFGIALLGLTVGAAIGSAMVTYHHIFGFDLHMFLGDQYSAGQFSLSMTVFPELSLVSILRSSLITIAFMLVAGLYPAWRASKLTPIEAMRSL